jgi:uncharacterized protein YndB with AHSA1/START domain
MSRLHFEAFIKRSPETVFQLLANLSGYASWLPPSELYSETSAVSEHPTKVGTAYIDKGPYSEMCGEVSELEPYSHLVFCQSGRFTSRWPGEEVEMHIRYTLRSTRDGTQVIRDVELYSQSILKVVSPQLVQTIKKESNRILQRIQWYMEAR